MRESINLEERVRFLKNQRELKYFFKACQRHTYADDTLGRNRVVLSMQMTFGPQLKRTASLSVTRSFGTFSIILPVLIYEVRKDLFHFKLLIENSLKTQKYPTPKNAITSKRFKAVDKSRKKPSTILNQTIIQGFKILQISRNPANFSIREQFALHCISLAICGGFLAIFII